MIPTLPVPVNVVNIYQTCKILNIFFLQSLSMQDPSRGGGPPSPPLIQLTLRGSSGSPASIPPQPSPSNGSSPTLLHSSSFASHFTQQTVLPPMRPFSSSASKEDQATLPPASPPPRRRCSYRHPLNGSDGPVSDFPYAIR